MTINKHTDVIVSPETLDSVLKRTAELSIKSELLVDDLQEYASNGLYMKYCIVLTVLSILYYKYNVIFKQRHWQRD